jgi:hypothetical protein
MNPTDKTISGITIQRDVSSGGTLKPQQFPPGALISTGPA